MKWQNDQWIQNLNGCRRKLWCNLGYCPFNCLEELRVNHEIPCCISISASINNLQTSTLTSASWIRSMSATYLVATFSFCVLYSAVRTLVSNNRTIRITGPCEILVVVVCFYYPFNIGDWQLDCFCGCMLILGRDSLASCIGRTPKGQSRM